uniref:FAD-dependent oxidoreductase n=1 Tax=Microbulbifer agarilyticus TaxID=260552 RepID=UPI0002558A70|nr:FAD-dependent oxidoreductase [Microbulbifer agarilyticus]
MSAGIAVRQAQVAVIGASLGGVMAAWQLCRAGVKTILTSEFPWIGGQMTSQGVPPDEHRYIESFGLSESYKNFRDGIRAHYRSQEDFVDHSVMTEGCNPGDGWVSRLCFEPEVAERYFRQLLQPYLDSELLTLLELRRPVAASRNHRKIESVTLETLQGSTTQIEVRADYFLDATDTGALLDLARLPCRLGKESKKEFAEPQAPEKANRDDQQPVTFVCALRCHDSPCEPIPKPEEYEFWRSYILPHYDYPLFSDLIPAGEANLSTRFPLLSDAVMSGRYSDSTLDLWRYRRIIAAHNWQLGTVHDVSLINWAQNDYALHPLLDGDNQSEQEVVESAKALTRCFVHWLQTEAPRDCIGEEGAGFPELALAEDVLGTNDGFAQQVYVRESRRIRGLQTLSQNDIILHEGSDESWQPAVFSNSVGIGLYNMDIHPTCVSGMGTNAAVRPFELPLGVFIPVDVDNLLPACKNISVTHLVNAATRVHPIEWLIGEVAGLLATYCLQTETMPAGIYESEIRVKQFQQLLETKGISLHWPSAPDSAS